MTDKPDKKKPEPRRPSVKKKRIAIGTALVLLAMFLLLMLLTVCACAQTITGKVVGVRDGDTISVLDGAKERYTISLEGIDAPESAHVFGVHSAEWRRHSFFQGRRHSAEWTPPFGWIGFGHSRLPI